MSFWKSFRLGATTKSVRKHRPRHQGTRWLHLESLEDRRVFSAAPLDGGFSELLACEYDDSAAQVAAVEISADLQATQQSQANSGQGSDSGFVRPDLALSDVEAEDYSAIVFSGGWGMSQYQYGFEGTYHNAAYLGDRATKEIVNDLINDSVAQDKYLTAICNGVTVLAWARVDGVSPLAAHSVAAWSQNLPSADGGIPHSAHDQVEPNGDLQFPSGAIGDPATSTDDVYVDGNIITAENFGSAYECGRTITARLLDH